MSLVMGGEGNGGGDLRRFDVEARAPRRPRTRRHVGFSPPWSIRLMIAIAVLTWWFHAIDATEEVFFGRFRVEKYGPFLTLAVCEQYADALESRSRFARYALRLGDGWACWPGPEREEPREQ